MQINLVMSSGKYSHAVSKRASTCCYVIETLKVPTRTWRTINFEENFRMPWRKRYVEETSATVVTVETWKWYYWNSSPLKLRLKVFPLPAGDRRKVQISLAVIPWSVQTFEAIKWETRASTMPISRKVKFFNNFYSNFQFLEKPEKFSLRNFIAYCERPRSAWKIKFSPSKAKRFPSFITKP